MLLACCANSEGRLNETTLKDKKKECQREAAKYHLSSTVRKSPEGKFQTNSFLF
jgi:hypothetical protein